MWIIIDEEKILFADKEKEEMQLAFQVLKTQDSGCGYIKSKDGRGWNELYNQYGQETKGEIKLIELDDRIASVYNSLIKLWKLLENKRKITLNEIEKSKSVSEIGHVHRLPLSTLANEYAEVMDSINDMVDELNTFFK